MINLDYAQNPAGTYFERFYEKVIKVKADVAADVAALLDLFSDVRVTAQSSWERSATQFS